MASSSQAPTVVSPTASWWGRAQWGLHVFGMGYGVWNRGLALHSLSSGGLYATPTVGMEGSFMLPAPPIQWKGSGDSGIPPPPPKLSQMVYVLGAVHCFHTWPLKLDTPILKHGSTFPLQFFFFSSVHVLGLGRHPCKREREPSKNLSGVETGL